MQKKWYVFTEESLKGLHSFDTEEEANQAATAKVERDFVGQIVLSTGKVHRPVKPQIETIETVEGGA